MSKLFLNPYLTFNNNTREVMEFYHKVLGGKLDLQTFGEAMPDGHEGNKDGIMHARLESDDALLMASDGMAGDNVNVGDNVSLALGGTDKAHLSEIFNGLSEGGEVVQPLTEASWGDTFGMFTDKFGIHWMVNISKV